MKYCEKSWQGFVCRWGIVLLAAALSACATSTMQQSRFEIDQAKVAAVERAAARQGSVSVYWINPPLRAIDDAETSDPPRAERR